MNFLEMSDAVMRKKISILGAGNVGATIAYTLAVDGMASEIVIVDINKDKARGEALDIHQGTPLCPPVDIHDGDIDAVADSNIVIVTVGAARKPGQSRIDLAQGNVNIIKSLMPQVVRIAPDAVYVVVSNPVDVLTYALIRSTGLPPSQVMGTGTMLDSSRLRAKLAKHVGLNPQNIHAYVFGEHGDSSLIPWSLTTIAGMPMANYCTHICERHNRCGKEELRDIEEDVRTSGARVIGLKGATLYAIALAVRHICHGILRDTHAVMTVSGLLEGQYGLSDVCLSLPHIIGHQGIEGTLTPPLAEDELQKLYKSADVLRGVLSSLDIG